MEWNGWQSQLLEEDRILPGYVAGICVFITEIQRASLTHLGLAPTGFQRKQEEDGKPADLISAAT